MSDAVPGETEIVRAQGLEFINIPIKCGDPTEADFRAFIAAMERLGERPQRTELSMRHSRTWHKVSVVVGSR